MVSTVTARVMADAEPTEDSQSLIISYCSLANLGIWGVYTLQHFKKKKKHKNASLEKGTLLVHYRSLFLKLKSTSPPLVASVHRPVIHFITFNSHSNDTKIYVLSSYPLK